MDFTKLKDCLDNIVENRKTPGVDCLVYKDHEIIYRYFTGKRDLENDIDMNGNELYFIYSMTKMITCVSSLQLYEKGAYKMDDPVFKYLPEFENMKVSMDDFDTQMAAKIASGAAMGEEANGDFSGYAKNKITIKDLFTMAGGLDYALEDDVLTKAKLDGKKTTRELVGAMSEKVLGFEPGTRFRYSLCHDVLGALIEVWSGKSLGVYMTENIFRPLGMDNTFFGLPRNDEELSRMAARYSLDENGNVKREPMHCVYNISDEYQSGGAGLISCTGDYALFLDALACGGVGKTGNRILETETIELMSSNHLQGKLLEDFHELRKGYGYGLGVRTHMEPEISGSKSPVGEFGWDGAAGAFSMVDTVKKISITYFQHFHGWDLKSHEEMRNALYDCLDTDK